MDIVERLRTIDPYGDSSDALFEAAAEIERLREAINQMLDSGCNTDAYLIGTAALQQKESE